MPSSVLPDPSLPPPSDHALAVSARLVERIRSEIADAGGWIPFSRFMELALYAPGLGYYSAGAAKLGPGPADGSDFTTAPERSSLFGRTIARGIAEVLREGERMLTEFGGGTGALAADVLLELDALGITVERYRLIELSADLAARQRATLAERAPALAGRVEWHEHLPDRLDGVVLGNEVLDAMPVELYVRQGASWQQRGVAAGIEGRAFAYVDRPAEWSSDEFDVPDGYLRERHPVAEAFVRTLVERMTPDAVALFIDYGFPASEYFHPQRTMGTLMAHYRHRAHGDLLAWPGLQDLTAHVDFSGLARAVTDAGGTVLGYTSQAAYLLDAGLPTLFAGEEFSPAARAKAASELQTLVSEAEMGELFKVFAFGRVARSLPGFTRDRRPSL